MLHILDLPFCLCNNQIILFGPNGTYPTTKSQVEISTNEVCVTGWVEAEE